MESALICITNYQAHAQQQVEHTKINKLWETTNDLKNPESVAYAPKQNVMFVSNVNGNPTQKDQNGFISKVSPSNGNIIELNWVTGLNAPKGVAISNNNSRLYVSDITDLVEIDIDNRKIISDSMHREALFLMMSYQTIREISMYLIQLPILSTSWMAIIIRLHYKLGYKAHN